MAYTKKVWVDEIPDSIPVKYEIVDDTDGELASSATIDVITTIATEGTPFTAANMNNIEDGIEAVDTALTALSGDVATLEGTVSSQGAAITALEDATDELPDFDANGPGALVQATAGGAVSVRRDNLSAAAAPTVNDDSGDGYSIGSRWLDVTHDEEYVCLDATGGAAAWKQATNTMIGASVLNGSAQSIPSGVATALNFPSEDWDTDNMHDAVTQNDRVVCRTPGLYMVFGTVLFAANNASFRSLAVRKNGATTPADVLVNPVADPVYVTTVNVSWPIYLDEDDYLQLFALHAVGTALNVVTSALVAIKIG